MEFNAPLVFTEFFLRVLEDNCFGDGREQPGVGVGGRKATEGSLELKGTAASPAAPGSQPAQALQQDGGRHAAALARGWNSMAQPRPAAQSGEAEMGGNPTTLAR